MSGDQPQYATVCCDDKIISYTLYLERDATLAEALVRAREEFPADATGGELVDLGECMTQEWHSPAIEAVLERPYLPLVAFYPPNATYPVDEQRWQAIFAITEPGEAGTC